MNEELLKNLNEAGLTEEQYNQLTKECALNDGSLQCMYIYYDGDKSRPILDIVNGKFNGILCLNHKQELDQVRAEKALRKKKQLYLDLGYQDPNKPKREQIPQKVREEVWRRDQGRCVTCGSRDKLEFDHILPVAKGGSNSTRNIELLCQLHNRRKSDSI